MRSDGSLSYARGKNRGEGAQMIKRMLSVVVIALVTAGCGSTPQKTAAKTGPVALAATAAACLRTRG